MMFGIATSTCRWLRASGITYLGPTALRSNGLGVDEGHGDVQGAEDQDSVLSVASCNKGPRRWHAVGIGRSLVGVASR